MSLSFRYHAQVPGLERIQDRKSTRLNSSHSQISYAVFCLKKKKKQTAACVMQSETLLDRLLLHYSRAKLVSCDVLSIYSRSDRFASDRQCPSSASSHIYSS